MCDCGKHGHIRPYCYRLHGYPQSHGQPRINTQSVKARKEWKPRGNNGEVLITSARSKNNCFMWVPKNVAPLQSHRSTDDVTKKRMKHVAKKKKSTKNVSSHVTPNAPIIDPTSLVDSVSVNPIIVEKLENKKGKMESSGTKKKSLEIDVADDVPDIVSPVERNVGEKRLPVNVSVLSWIMCLFIQKQVFRSENMSIKRGLM